MPNPVNINWTAPKTYVDGTVFGQADHGGYEIEVNAGTGLFAVPIGWDADGVYEFPVVSLPGRVQGANKIRMRTVAKNGSVSDWTPYASFTYLSVPQPPTSLAVA